MKTLPIVLHFGKLCDSDVTAIQKEETGAQLYFFEKGSF